MTVSQAAGASIRAQVSASVSEPALNSTGGEGCDPSARSMTRSKP
jgi:hypothetical protein